MCFEIFVLSEKYFIKQRILQYHTHLKGRVVYLQKKLENYIIKYFKGDKEYKEWTHYEEPKSEEESIWIKHERMGSLSSGRNVGVYLPFQYICIAYGSILF